MNGHVLALRSKLTKVTCNSPCSYEEVISELERQVKYWKQGKKDEDSARKSEKKHS